MSCANHKDFDPRCHACLDSAAGKVGATGHPMASGPILASGPTRPGYQHSPATYVEGREAPRVVREWGTPDGPWIQYSDGTSHRQTGWDVRAIHQQREDDATVERCARAALDGYEGNDPPMYSSDWGQLPEDDRDAWRDVARAVLAAARTKRAVNSGGAL